MRGLLGLLLLGGIACAPPPTPAPKAAPPVPPASRPAATEPAPGPAPGAPGEVSTWTSGAKEAVGTAAGVASKLWFTLQGGVVSEVYYPRLDMANVRTLELAVSDGRRAWLESEPGLERKIEWLDERGLLYRQTSRHPQGLFRIEKTTLTDPARATLLVEVAFQARDPRLELHVLYDPSLANTCTGDSGWSEGDALLAQEGSVASALVAQPPLARPSTGYVGRSDGRTDLLRHGRLTWRHARAERGNVLQAATLARGGRVTLALGFGATPAAALAGARASLGRGFAALREAYLKEWAEALRGVRVPREERYRRAFRLAVLVLRAHEDKTYRGANIASMSIPWGHQVRADRADIGGYHLVWSRDLYQVATALLAVGDRPAAERALDYLFKVQQRPDGSFPQNSWLDGKAHWQSLQLDEVAFPVVLAWQLGRRDRETWERHVRPAAELLLARGPATPQERWEEEGGYSPSTIAAEIAGLVCAAELASANSAAADAKRYLKAADQWAGSLEKWLVTRTGPLDAKLKGKRGYYLRINDNTRPDDGAPLDINNGGGSFDERTIVDAGFLELVRLGIRPANDPVIERSLQVVDATIRVATPRGPGWYRYNHDGYGEKADGSGFAGSGVGRLWPLLTGERGEYELARGGDAKPYLDAMVAFANAGGMMPEQVWDRPEPTPRGFRFGQGTDGATPLAWTMAQFLRLVVCAEEGKLVEQPAVVAARYLRRSATTNKGRGGR